MTGFHALHVFGGLVVLAIILVMGLRGKLNRHEHEISGGHGEENVAWVNQHRKHACDQHHGITSKAQSPTSKVGNFGRWTLGFGLGATQRKHRQRLHRKHCHTW